MTAGQRNCFLAIEGLLLQYKLDDVLVAVEEHVRILAERQRADSAERRICKRAANEIEQVRGWTQGITG